MDHPAPLAVGFTHLTGGADQCPLVTTLLTADMRSTVMSGSRLKLSTAGQHAWRDASRSSSACSNACGRIAKNRAATRRTFPASPAILGIDPDRVPSDGPATLTATVTATAAANHGRRRTSACSHAWGVGAYRKDGQD